jgi:cytochrome c peroxidase
MRKSALLTPWLVLFSLLLFTGCPGQPIAETVAEADGAAETDLAAEETEPPTPPIPDALALFDSPAPAPEPVAESTPVEADEPAVAETSAKSVEFRTAAIKAAAPAAPVQGTETVMLGTGELTRGIPGEGDLTVEEIREWLDQPTNHVPLNVQLPLGLAAGVQSIHIPDDNPITRAKVELGRQLYFDRRMSADGTISCADCHHPDEGYTRLTRFGVGVDGQEGNRNSPVSYNRILSTAQFWDGRAASLEEQAIGPIANPIEMANTHDVCVETVAGIEGYRLQFEKIFGEEVNIEDIGKAIATFERVIVTGPSPFDYWEPVRRFQEVLGDQLDDLEALEDEDPDLYDQYMEVKEVSDQFPMSESARRGHALFFSDKTSCTACHVGANFTDEKYHNLGVGMDAEDPDLGRYVVTGVEEDKGAFKTPTLRNVELTAPYMHDGSQETLEETVEWYAKGGHPNPYLSKDVRKLELTDQDKADLVEFMKALTGEFPEMETGRLPQ